MIDKTRWKNIHNESPDLYKEVEFSDGENVWIGSCTRYDMTEKRLIATFVPKNYDDHDKKFKFWREIEKTTTD